MAFILAFVFAVSFAAGHDAGAKSGPSQHKPAVVVAHKVPNSEFSPE